MFKALAQRIARYVLRDELCISALDYTELQDHLDNARDFINDLEWDIKELREKNAALKQQLHAADHDNAFLYEQLKELRAENNGLRIDLDNGSNFTNELMAELRELRGAKDNAVRLLNLCEPPF